MCWVGSRTRTLQASSLLPKQPREKRIRALFLPFFSIFTTPISARRLRRESCCFSRAVGAQKARCQRQVLEIFASTAQNWMLSCTFWVLVASGAWLWLRQRCWGRGRAQQSQGWGDVGLGSAPGVGARCLGVQILKCLDLGRSDLRSWVLGSSDLGSRMLGCSDLKSWMLGSSDTWILDAQISDSDSWKLGCSDLGCWEAQISDLGRRAEAGHLWEGEFKLTAACKCKITRAASPWDGIWRFLGGKNSGARHGDTSGFGGP